jgi:hypothetical protein
MQHGGKFIDLKNFFMMCYIVDDELLRIMDKGRENGGEGGGPLDRWPHFFENTKMWLFSNESAALFYIIKCSLF